MKRRNFLKIGAAGAVAMHIPNILASPDLRHIREIPTRPLGSTGERITIVGFGGIALRNNGQEFANELVAAGYARGIKYFDIAPNYGDAQALLGPALEPYRDQVFLACKSHERSREGSRKNLEESLKQLRTDHFELYQLHALSTMEDIEKCFGPDGAMETLIKARKEGKVRYLGFSAHNEEVALKAMELFDFDTILYPINCVCWHNGNFGPAVYETAKSKGMGILALKAVAKTRLNGNERFYPNMWYEPYLEEGTIANSLRFTLSKDIAATVHAGDSVYMKKTLQFVHDTPEITAPPEKKLQAMIEGVEPLFNHPA